MSGSRLWRIYDFRLEHSDDGGKTWTAIGVEAERTDQLLYDAQTQRLHIGSPEAIARALEEEGEAG